jgi:hypothetical protein
MFVQKNWFRISLVLVEDFNFRRTRNCHWHLAIEELESELELKTWYRKG